MYIAHPLAGGGSVAWGDTEANFARYLDFCAFATNMGYAVISWAGHYLTHLKGDTSLSGDEYIALDIRLLRGASRLWIAGPLEASRGMRAEHQAAARLRIPMLQCREWLDPKFYPTGRPFFNKVTV